MSHPSMTVHSYMSISTCIFFLFLPNTCKCLYLCIQMCLLDPLYSHMKCTWILRFFILLILVVMAYNLNRDGVSEGQFYQVLLYELDAIRKVRIETLQCYVSYSLCDICGTNVEAFVALNNNFLAGLCFSRTKLSTTSDFHCCTKKTSHPIVCQQP